MTDTARWKSTIYIGGLPPQVTLQTIQEAFIPFGEIVDVQLPNNDSRNRKPDAPVDSPHRGYAYVEFEDPEDAKEAIDNMDQSELFGRVIKVSAAKIPKSATANQGLGSKTAVWEQEGWLAENAVSEEDRMASEQALNNAVLDPMQGLEGLDVAGPKPE
ncbi:peptidyl-prolyl cis-trans isomerase E [Cladorrhinum samala]|uniref:Peptidyl-prolyl cis-trans isomerase E n=1 Tax=Cladorrhinum samala TaxID=585594 RepID=A0AAV9HDK6_9PEZI|nr:peptidyl-prolyl cis-trans isomerase E [Cladorrhinum samala]